MGTSRLRPISIPDLITLQKKGEAYGIASICSANPFVLNAVMHRAAAGGWLALIEATANQVNQFGGYMGMTPVRFRQYIQTLEAGCSLAPGQVVLGGDHLGPTVWQDEPAAAAMEKAGRLVADFVQAGFTKIHLDASMALGGDPPGGLNPEVAAQRTAQLCRQAEAAYAQLPFGSPPPCYVVGTEVPIPGGEIGNDSSLAVTTVASARTTLELLRKAFSQASLQAAWERVVALVVQPGVEYGNQSVHAYCREEARQLSAFIETQPGLVFEAHSTDYQAPAALRALVEDHFAILKVGPALTFAFREAVFALAQMETELCSRLANRRSSHLLETLESAMLSQPRHWQRYYPGSPAEQAFLRKYSLSDRIRYYWNHPEVATALERLLANLEAIELPASLVSQYLPGQYLNFRQGLIPSTPRALIEDRIGEVLKDYAHACGQNTEI